MLAYSALKAKIEKDMDLEDEDFVQDTELMEYFNDAIRDCEGEVHKIAGLPEIYFLNYDNPAIVSGTKEYVLPTDIYENKLVKCIYNNGSRVFAINELRGRRRFEDMAFETNIAPSNPIYRFYLRNIRTSDTAIATKWGLTPTPQESSSTYFTRWYIRKANRMTATTSVCDLPETCYNFLYAYIGWRVWGKEGDARAEAAENEKEKQRAIMIQNLVDMTPDEDDKLEMDTSSYDEMS